MTASRCGPSPPLWPRPPQRLSEPLLLTGQTLRAEMYSQYWSSTGGADYRRYTVVEGDALLPLGSTCRRKRLRSSEEEEQEEQEAGRSRRGQQGEQQEEQQEEQQGEQQEALQSLCQRCHIMASQLNRQAAGLVDSSALKDPAYASFLLRKLQYLQRPRGGRHSAEARCHFCGASFQQLRRRALRRALGVGGDATPLPACPAPPAEGGGAPWAWPGVQSVYLGGGGAKALATVTPLPPGAHPHLEGVWRVSCSGHQDSTSAGGHVTGVRPAGHSVATQTSAPPSAAAAFFIRAAQRLSLSRRRTSPPGDAPDAPGPPLLYRGGFSGALQLSPPPVPPGLLLRGSKVKDAAGRGKVRVLVRVGSVDGSVSSGSASVLKVDGRRKTLTLCRASSCASSCSSSELLRRSSAAQTFTFDGVFLQDASQAEVCLGAVPEVLRSVVGGADGCIFCYGHANLGKTYTMIGRECSAQSLGVAPTAVSWLFSMMEERRQKSGARFSVRVSAVELSGQQEALTDLLAQLGPSAGGRRGPRGPAVALREDPLCGSQLQNHTELRASSAERAAFFLDAAVAARRRGQEAGRNSHFLFTLHLYQERAAASSKASVSGRSRLHLLDLGSCETDVSRTREGGGALCLSLSALGNVLLALTSGARRVPYRDSKLAMLLAECLANINCAATMIAHVCAAPASFLETLSTLQLAARIHRTARTEAKRCEEAPPTRLQLHSDPDCSSGSEAPPTTVPIVPSLTTKRAEAPPAPDGGQFKCDTFAELQERLGGAGGGATPAEDRSADREPVGTPRRAQREAEGDAASVTLHQQVALNQEDRLVLTLVEELPGRPAPGNGRPARLLGFGSPGAAASRPVSIIGSITDEYDAYAAQQGAPAASGRRPEEQDGVQLDSSSPNTGAPPEDRHQGASERPSAGTPPKSGRRAETSVRLPRLGRGTTRGRALRFSSLDKSSMAAKSRPGDVCPPPAPDPDPSRLQLSSGPKTGGAKADSSHSGRAAPPSPYSAVTAPRRPPPAARRSARLHHSSASSGYESAVHDGDAAGGASSPSGSPRKRGGGFPRRRWGDAAPPGGPPMEPIHIKVYQIEEVERLHSGRKAELRMEQREQREQLLQEQQVKRERLQEELEELRRLLMAPAGRCSARFHVDQDLDRESQEYLEALVEATAQLESYVSLCKARLMMETCFDICSSSRVELELELQV